LQPTATGMHRQTVQNRTWLALAVFSSLILSVSALAGTEHWHEDKNHWKEHWQYRNFDDDDEYDHRASGCYFEPGDVWLVGDYFAKRYRPLPPGTAKRYYRAGALPTGWKNQIVSLPPTLEHRLVVLPEGYRRGVVGGSLIVYDPKMELILDSVVLFGR
jgi:hypothetical protein